MVRYLFSIGLLSLILITGCSHSPILDSIAPEAVSSTKSYFDLLRHKQYEPIESALDASLKSPDTRNTMTGMAAMIPDEQPVSVKTVEARVSCKAGVCDNDIVLEYQFSKTWLLVNIVTRKENSKSSIVGFHMQTLPESVEETNRFTLLGKNFGQYILLLLAIVFPVFSVGVLLLCIQTKLEPKLKWPWAAFILIGLCSLDVSWTKGQFAFHFFKIHLLSVGLHAVPYGPWILSISLPLGAILFPIYRVRLLRAKFQAALIDSVQRRGNQGVETEEQSPEQLQSQDHIQVSEPSPELLHIEEQNQNPLEVAEDQNQDHIETEDQKQDHVENLDQEQGEPKAESQDQSEEQPDEQLHDQLEAQLEAQPGEQLEDRLEDQLKDQLEAQLEDQPRLEAEPEKDQPKEDPSNKEDQLQEQAHLDLKSDIQAEEPMPSQPKSEEPSPEHVESEEQSPVQVEAVDQK